MPRFRPAIRSKEKRSDGKVSLKIAVTHNHDIRYVKTDYHIPPKCFDESARLVIPGKGLSASEADKINNKVQILIGVMNQKCEKQHNLRFMDIRSLMDLLRDKHTDMDVFAVFDIRIEKLLQEGKINYHGLYRRTRDMLRNFTGASFLPFETIDYNFLVRMERDWRIKGLGTTSIGYHMRNIRAVWNEGRKRGLVDMSLNPFWNYQVPKSQNRHFMTLTPEEMATMAKIDIEDPLMRWSRDISMLIFCLIGINMKDLAGLKSIHKGRIAFKREKGKREYSIKVPPQALHIINRYRGKKGLVNILDNYSDYRTATKRINYKLKDLATLCKINKSVSTYSFRHSWSAYARFLGISKDDIAGALGHRRIELPTVTEFYDDIQEEQRRIDLANKKVIRLILKTSPVLPRP